MVKPGNSSPTRTRRTSAGIGSPANHAIESVEGEEESFEVKASSNNSNNKRRSGTATVTAVPVNGAAPIKSDSLTPIEDAPAMDVDNEPESSASGGLDICPVCSNIPEEQRKRKSTSKESWIGCEKCEQWFHWNCVCDDLDVTKGIAGNDLHTWYCKACLDKDAEEPGATPLAIKLKDPTRKSARKKAEIDYGSHDPPPQPTPPRTSGSRSNPWRAVAESRGPVKTHFRKMKAEQLTLDWLESDPKAFMEPIFIDNPEGLDMRVLPANIKISEIAQLVGPDKPIDVIDVASQSGLNNWTLGRWATYYEDPKREKVRNVISLELSSSPLKDRVASPRLVRQIDWVEQHWPGDLKAQDIYPQVSRYCLMSPGESWTDWHIDFSASSVFYHILRGRKVFYFISPTPENLRKYEIWSGSASQQSGVWLGDECDRVYRVELKPGNTLIIPSGWIHCVYTPVDALVIGGNFLHSYNIATQLRVYQIELNTKVPKKFRFPYFVSMLWYVAWHFHRQLETEHQKHNLRGTQVVSHRILQGLKALSAFLVEQTYRIADGAKGISAERRRVAIENIPSQIIENPTQMAKDFQTMVYIALDEEHSILQLPEDGIPKFDASQWIDAAPYEFLKEQYGPNASPTKAVNGSRSSVTGSSAKRKASLTPAGQQNGPPPKTPKFRHWNGVGADGQATSRLASPANGWTAMDKPSGPSFERLERQSFEPVTATTRQRRQRPDVVLATSAQEFDSAHPARKQEWSDVEVRTTNHENVVRKTVPGEVPGSWVVETRKIVTVIERIYFPPPDKTTTTKSALHQRSLNGSIEEERKPSPTFVAMEQRDFTPRPPSQPAEARSDVTATAVNGTETATANGTNGVHDPHDEISQMLGKAEGLGHEGSMTAQAVHS